MGLIAIREMMKAGDLKLWHDYRSGHCANQAGYALGVFGAGTFDGGVYGIAGRFRSGLGYETSHDFTADPISLGYIRVLDNATFYPPADGMCLIASYMQTDPVNPCQIIGQFSDRGAAGSWQLFRTPTEIRFVTSDGAATSTFAYAIAAVPGQIETVIVRYTGGVGANNCTIVVAAPVVSFSTGQITRVPQDVALPVSVCCYSNSQAGSFMGTMRYCAYIRGAQTTTSIGAVAAEMEAISWPDAVGVYDTTGSVADRAVHYMSRFGVDQSVADEGVVGSQLSNSPWVFGDAMKGGAGTWRVNPLHTQYDFTFGGPSDVQKMLHCISDGTLKLPYENWDATITSTSAAYGTWDFWVRLPQDPTAHVMTYVVHTITTDGGGTYYDDGYAVMFSVADSFNMRLCRIDDGVVGASLITTPEHTFDDGGLIHIRVTRTLNNDWCLYYSYGAGWVYVGTAVDATYTVSDGMFLDYIEDEALLLGNQRSDKALYKWRGVVNPL